MVTIEKGITLIVMMNVIDIVMIVVMIAVIIVHIQHRGIVIVIITVEMTKMIEEDPHERGKHLPKTIIVVGLNTKKDIEGTIGIDVVAVVVEATTTKKGNENAVEKRAAIVSTKNGIASTVVTAKFAIIRKGTQDRDIADAVQVALYKCGEHKIAKVIINFVYFRFYTSLPSP